MCYLFHMILIINSDYFPKQINKRIFEKNIGCIFSEVRHEYLNIETIFSFKGLIYFPAFHFYDNSHIWIFCKTWTLNVEINL
jgi:hypothetical protein